MNNGIYVVAKGQGYLANININRFEPLPQTLVTTSIVNKCIDCSLRNVQGEFGVRLSQAPSLIPGTTI